MVLEYSQNIGKASQILVMKVLDVPSSGHEDYYGTLKKVVRNSGYSKSDNFKKLPVLAHT